MHEGRQDILIVFHIDKDADRLAMAATARQRVCADGEELAACREEQKLVRRLGMESELELVAFLEGERREIGQMPLHRAQPALFGYNDRDRLALDHCLMNVFQIVGWRVGEGRAARTKLGLRAELFAYRLDFGADLLPLACARSEQPFEIGLLDGEIVELLADFEFLELAQRTQAHIEDRLGLNVGQLEGPHQVLLRLILLADDADHFIQIKIGDQEAAKDFQASFDFRQTELRTADKHFLAMVEPLAQNAAQRQNIRHLAM